MFGKMMNQFYYGKSGKGDYNKENLPQNRWQLFWEMLKIRLSGLCRLNLMYAVAWLPVLLVTFGAVMQYLSVASGVGELQAQFDQGLMTAEVFAEAGAQFLDWQNAFIIQTLLLLTPCLVITGPFTAGIAYVTRNWARDEHAFVWSDFKDAVKDNWKQGLAVSAITSPMPLILYMCWMFYGDMAMENALFIIPQVLSVMFVAIWLSSLLFQYPLMITYKLRMRDVFRNALFLTVGRLPMTIGLKLLSLAPIMIAVLVSLFTAYYEIAVLVLAFYYLLFGFSLSRFIGASYSNAVFDRFINPNIEGAEVDRGLYREEDEEAVMPQ